MFHRQSRLRKQSLWTVILSALILIFLEHFFTLVFVDSTLLHSALSAFLSCFCVFQLTSVICVVQSLVSLRRDRNTMPFLKLFLEALSNEYFLAGEIFNLVVWMYILCSVLAHLIVQYY